MDWKEINYADVAADVRIEALLAKQAREREEIIRDMEGDPFDYEDIICTMASQGERTHRWPQATNDRWWAAFRELLSLCRHLTEEETVLILGVITTVCQCSEAKEPPAADGQPGPQPGHLQWRN
jgi:hypothetical protein